MSSIRMAKMMTAALAIGVIAAPAVLDTAPGDAAPRTRHKGRLAGGETKDLLTNHQSSTIKVSATLSVCELSEGAAASLVARGSGGAWTLVCVVHPSEDKNCNTRSCTGELPAGKTLNVLCDAGEADTGGGLDNGCSYDVTVN